jgi:lipopolysaccharide/colanic/teichoic acid biosynthesis glycosyltransferase
MQNNFYCIYIKKFLDIVICIVFGLPVFAILLMVFGLLIKLEDRGTVFYTAKRIGKKSKLYTMYKFRTMKVDAPFWLNPDGSTYNAKDDPRLTKIGKFMRSTSIDEVPQIINIFKGEMSIIGPRPSASGALGTFKEDEINKMNVLPGITGYVAAYFRNTVTNREKRLYDAWYADNVTFWLDVKIFFTTIFTVLTRKGVYANDPASSPLHTQASEHLPRQSKDDR